VHVVITGGSSGIGLAVATIYARRGYRVSLIGRNVARLEAAREAIRREATNASIFTTSADVSLADQAANALTDCEVAHGPCDILVASAGVVEPGWFHDQEGAAWRAQWQTNLDGVANAVHFAYPKMRQRGRGSVMIVSSAAAFIGIPAYAAYCASKAALVGFADSLRLEAMPSGVRIGICFPPDTDTPQLAQELRGRPAEAQMLMGRIRPRPAGEIAAKIVYGIDKGRARVYFNLSVWALAMFGPMLRPWIALWYTARVGRPRH
jgi:3-dehydrosphinganine reductase